MTGDLDQAVPIQTRKAHGWTLGWYNDLPDATTPSSGLISITRSVIGSTIIGPNKTFISSGFTTSGDLGTNAVYTSVGAGPSGPLAIQDAAGTWFNLVVVGWVNAGWFGVKGDGITDDTANLQAAIDFCIGGTTGVT